MNKERLLNLSKYLRTLPPEKWNFDTIIEDCGTCGCAIGQLPNVDPEHCKYSAITDSKIIVRIDGEMVTTMTVAVIANYFAIPTHDAHRIFLSPSHYTGGSRCKVSALMVADEIDEYIASHV